MNARTIIDFLKDTYASSNVVDMLDVKSLIELSTTCSSIWNILSRFNWEKVFMVPGHRKRSLIGLREHTLILGLDYPQFDTQAESNTFWRHMCLRVCTPEYNLYNPTSHLDASIGIKLAGLKCNWSAYHTMLISVCSNIETDSRVVEILVKMLINCGTDYDLQPSTTQALQFSNKDVLKALYPYTSFSTNKCISLFDRFKTRDLMYICGDRADIHMIRAAVIKGKCKLLRHQRCTNIPLKKHDFFKTRALSVRMLETLIACKHLRKSHIDDVLGVFVQQPWCTIDHIDVIVDKFSITSQEARVALRHVVSRECENRLLHLA